MGVNQWILFLTQKLNQTFLDTLMLRMEKYIKFRVRVSKVTEVVIRIVIKRNARELELLTKAAEEFISFQIGFTGVGIASNVNCYSL